MTTSNEHKIYDGMASFKLTISFKRIEIITLTADLFFLHLIFISLSQCGPHLTQNGLRPMLFNSSGPFLSKVRSSIVMVHYEKSSNDEVGQLCIISLFVFSF